MPQVFSIFISSPSEVIQYDSTVYGYNVCEICSICSKKVIYQESISACKCYRYSHRKCLIQSLNKLNQNKSKCSFKCDKCSYQIKSIQISNIEPKFHLRIQNLLIFGISAFVMLLALYNLSTKVYKSTISDIALLVVLAIALTIFSSLVLVSILNMVFIKKIQIRDIESTNMDMAISAFMNMEENAQIEELDDTQIDFKVGRVKDYKKEQMF